MSSHVQKGTKNSQGSSVRAALPTRPPGQEDPRYFSTLIQCSNEKNFKNPCASTNCRRRAGGCKASATAELQELGWNQLRCCQAQRVLRPLKTFLWFRDCPLFCPDASNTQQRIHQLGSNVLPNWSGSSLAAHKPHCLTTDITPRSGQKNLQTLVGWHYKGSG